MSTENVRSRIGDAANLSQKLNQTLTCLAQNEEVDAPAEIHTLSCDIDQVDQKLQELRTKYDRNKAVPRERTEMYRIIIINVFGTLQQVNNFVKQSHTGKGRKVKWNMDEQAAQCYLNVVNICEVLLTLTTISVSETGSAQVSHYTKQAIRLLDEMGCYDIPTGLAPIHSELRRGAQMSIAHAIDIRSAWYADYVKKVDIWKEGTEQLPGTRSLVYFLLDSNAHRVYFIMRLENGSELKFRVRDSASANADDDGVLSIFSCFNLHGLEMEGSTELKNFRIGFRVGFFNGKPPSEEMQEEFHLIKLLPENWFY